MNYNYNENFQYDSCVSQGICTINPRTSSLQEVLVLYLKLTSYYALKLYENGFKDEKARNIILNTISVMVSNFEFSERDFEALSMGFNDILPGLIEQYNSICKKNDVTPQPLKSILKTNQKVDIIKSIKLGEKEFLKKIKEIPTEIQDLYKILFVLAKSLCINIFDLESFEIDAEEGYVSILKLLNSLNTKDTDSDSLKKSIEEIAAVDNKLIKMLQTAKKERYGTPDITEVSYTTKPGKAILVVGSNIRELEDILESVKDKPIDVYTHDEMILANTYPKFRNYLNLKGQYGQGIENCLLDFATFPGPIILTRHSLYNVEHLYRGLLYTTDFAYSKGIIPIKNKDFSDVIKSAENSKGFKTGRQCESITLGYNYESLLKNIENKSQKFSRIFIIGLGAYTLEQKAYFEKLLTQTPENILVISLSYCVPRNNVICINACFDSYAEIQITEALLEDTQLPITAFFPKCGRHTISQMITLSNNKRVKIYLGKCTPIMLNPNMFTTFQKVFGIKSLTSVKKDLKEILADN